ncbi:hypothetical protein Droror1_Dr00010419 [Drosera rotundifolia]
MSVALKRQKQNHNPTISTAAAVAVRRKSPATARRRTRFSPGSVHTLPSSLLHVKLSCKRRDRMAYTQCGRGILRQIVQDGPAAKFDQLVNPILYAGHGIRYRKLEIILTTNVNKLGKAGETVKVAPGYFRNYLMPKLLAVPNIEKFAVLIREQRKIYEPKKTEEVTVVKESRGDQMSEYINAAKRLDNGKLVLRRYIKVDNEIHESVTKDEIVSEVARQLGVSIQPENLHLPTPLSSIGEFEVPLRLPRAIPLPEGNAMFAISSYSCWLLRSRC